MIFSIIPDAGNIGPAIEFSKKYNVNWEYNDFAEPEIYGDATKVDELVEFYKNIDRDRSADTMHGAFLGLDMAAMDEVLRNRSRELMAQSLDIADRLGIKGVVFHTGLIGELRVDYYLENWLNGAVEFWTEQCSRHPKLYVYMENSFEQEPDVLLELMHRMEGVTNFKLCLDYGHAALTSTPLDAWVRTLAPYIGHMHLNDNDLLNDLHMVPGTGKIDYAKWQNRMEENNIDTSVLLELRGYERIEQSIRYMQERLYAVQTEEPVQTAEPAIGQVVQRVDMSDKFFQILDIGIALSALRDPNKLLDYIVNTAMKLTGSDAGTLYLLKEDMLRFRIMKTRSKGVDVGGNGESIDIPPVPLNQENICAYSAINKVSLNIEDVYTSELFDFSGPKRYDAINEYHTQSMVAIPMIDQKDEVLGVMQLINAMDENGNVRAFSYEEEKILMALASQTAISISNMSYLEEIEKQMWSFTEAMTEAIDARTPYNASHTRNVAKYTRMIADHINELHKEGKEELFFTKDHRDQLVMAAFLHDIGKMIVPIRVMNKQTRLSNRMTDIENRLEKVKLLLQIDMLKGLITKEECETRTKQVDDTYEAVHVADSAGFLDDAKLEALQAVLDYKYISPDGSEEIHFLTEEEKACIQIRKGTLTDEEREIMESHVVMTERILSKVHFNKSYSMAPVWAAQHHECIDGSGYPNKIKGDELGPEARILAVADICDALLATDRPYKKPMPKDKAFAIMESMADEGKLEKRFIDYLRAVL